MAADTATRPVESASEVALIYRMRIYDAVRENLPVFHEFFRTQLLPVQLRHGARLIGRWETDDGRVVAIWEYDDRAAYERIEAAVRADPDSGKARRHRAELPPLVTAQDQSFMTSTVPRDLAPLDYLEEGNPAPGPATPG